MVFLGEAYVVDGPLTFHQASILKELHDVVVVVVVGIIGIGEHTMHVHVKPQYQYVSVRTYVVTNADNFGICGLLVSCGERDNNNLVNIHQHPLGGSLLCCCHSCS